MKKENAYILSFSMGAALLLSACNSSTPPPPPPPPASVDIGTVEEGHIAYHEEYPATITALNEVELRPQVSGYITGIHFQDGQHVQKGQLLYTIDQQMYEAGVSQAQANVAVAKANLQKVQKDADRYLELDRKDAIAKQVLDHSLAELESAKMQVKAAEAGLKGVQTNLRYSNIHAPFSGTIGISQVKLGASVSPGSTLLNTISSNDPISADFYLDQKDLPRFDALAKKHGNNDSTFTVMLPDGALYPASGRVATIDRAIDPRTGTIRARLSFANPERKLLPGMSVTVRIYHDKDEKAILIPHKAVMEQMGEFFVYSVTDSSTVTQVKIKPGITLKETLVVKEGLEPGQRIVIDGLQRVREGAKIQDAATAPQQTQASPKK